MVNSVNTNAYCYVVLTEFGNKILDRERQFYLANGVPYQEPLSTAHGLRFQLWELMQIFGPAMVHGNPDVPFVANEIKFSI